MGTDMDTNAGGVVELVHFRRGTCNIQLMGDPTKVGFALRRSKDGIAIAVFRADEEAANG